MSKVNFSKLDLKVNNGTCIFNWNEENIEVKNYLPVNKKLELVSEVVNLCVDEELKFYNPGKIEIYSTLFIFFEYTNIKFTDKQKEDSCKLYDLLVSSGLKDEVFSNIDKNEIDFIYSLISETIKTIYQYNHSVYGILDSLQTDYDGLNFNVNEIWQKLSNGENVEFLKEVIEKMG